MTKLEYINKAISFHRRMYNDYLRIGSEAKVVEEIKQDLEILQQIKNALEAWEVVNKELEYQEDIPCEERPEYTYKFKKWTFEINENAADFEEKSMKLKRAVEVKDEKVEI